MEITMSEPNADTCGVCERPADFMATVPMCGERPRYKVCIDCLATLGDYAEDVVMLGSHTGRPEEESHG
jgi:hypothetical protein